MSRRWSLWIMVAAVGVTACAGGDDGGIATAPESVTTSPVTTSPVTTSPVTTSPVTTSPVTTSPVTTSPVTTSPVTTSPVTTSPVTTSPVTTSPVTTAAGFVTAQLALVPADVRTGDGLFIQLADVATMASIAGTPAPAPGRSADDIISSLLAWERPADGNVALPTPALLGGAQTWQFATEILDDTGVDLGAIEHVVTASALPSEIVVTSGDLTLDGGSLTDLGGGLLSAGEGDDFSTDMGAAGGWRRIGQPVRFAERDGAVAWSTSTPLVESWLDGSGGSLGDDAAYAALGAALDAKSAIGAVISESDFGAAGLLPRTASPAEVERFAEMLPQIEPFSIAAVGIAPGGEFGARPLAVYVFADDDAANEAVGPIGELWAGGVSAATAQPFSDIVSVVAVDSIGPTVVVELDPVGAGGVVATVNMLARADIVFAHP